MQFDGRSVRNSEWCKERLCWLKSQCVRDCDNIVAILFIIQHRTSTIVLNIERNV